MSLSNISTHMANLEKRVGFKICNRGRSGFKLTPGGTELYASVEELFQSIDQFQNKAWCTKTHIGKELCLGIIDGLISERQFSIQKAIQCLSLKERNVLIRVRESQQPSYIDNLRTAAIVHSMEAAAMLILSGKYIGYLPDHFARRWEDTKELTRVLPA